MNLFPTRIAGLALTSGSREVVSSIPSCMVALSVVALGMVALLAPSFAFAQSAEKHSVEIQLSAATLDDQFRSEFQGIEICPESFSMGELDLVLDHVEFPHIGSFRRAEQPLPLDLAPGVTLDKIRGVEYVRPIDLFVKTSDCVEDPDCPAAQYLLVQSLDLITSLSVSVVVIKRKDKPDLRFPRICASLVGTEPELDFAPSLIPSFSKCTNIPMGALGSMVNGRQVQVAALAIDDAANTVAIRLGFDDSDSPLDTDGWTAFLEGEIGESLQGTDFNLIVERRLLMERFVGIINPNEIKMIVPDGDPIATWTPLAHGGAVVDVVTPVEVEVPLCPDIGANIFTHFQTSYDAAHEELVIDGSFDYSLNQWDMFVCGSLATPLLGPQGPFTIGIAVGVMNALASLFVPDADELGAKGLLPPECKALGEKSFSCRVAMHFPDLQFGPGGAKMAVDLTQGFGNALDMTFGGDAKVSGGVSSWTPHLSTSVDPFEFHLYWDCNSTDIGYSASVILHGQGRVCGAEISSPDPLHVFQVSEKHEAKGNGDHNGWLPARFRVDIKPPFGPNSYGANQYWKTPYGLDLTVYSTGGAKTERIKAPIRDLDAESYDPNWLWFIRKIECMELSEGWLGNPVAYNPLWDIDPAPIERNVVEQPGIEVAREQDIFGDVRRNAISKQIGVAREVREDVPAAPVVTGSDMQPGLNTRFSNPKSSLMTR